jgi:hypothetical protein
VGDTLGLGLGDTLGLGLAAALFACAALLAVNPSGAPDCGSRIFLIPFLIAFFITFFTILITS